MKTKINLLLVGLFLAATSSALATVRYVNVNNANPAPPYTNWATAATNIQDAVDAAGAGDEIVVTNGTYASGSRADPYSYYDTRVVVDKPLVLSSVNGPDVTVIDGGGSGTVRCLYLTNDAVLVGFTLTNGAAYLGGGVYCESTNAVLTNCVLTGNWTRKDGWGGGAYGGTLNNCMLTGNSASDEGGGAYGGTLNNCTLTGNSASDDGGGAYSCSLNNCIVYFNSAPVDGNYDSYSTLNYCCTTPMPTNGVGNISADPQLASASHLSALSPCIGAGSATYASGTDIDGEAWANPPSIGCDEYHAGAVTGPLTVSLTATYTNVATGFPVGLTAFIEGRTDLSVWDFGDGDVEVNEPYTSHAWTAPGDYLVSLWAFSDSYPEGVSAMVTVRVLNHPVQYVSLGSTNPVAPYTSWATAATNIQNAVDVAPPGATIFVTNGTYAPVLVNRSLTLQSVNGPGVTVINGGGTSQCVYLTKDEVKVMVGFTLTNGLCSSGGGVYCESTSVVLSNCVLSGNSAEAGGGAYGGTLNNCVLTGNSAIWDGGGAYGGTLNNCVLTGNSAPGGDGGGACVCTLNNCTLTGNSATGQYAGGGGAWLCTLNNCIVYFNSAPVDGNYDSSSTLNYCCTTPMPTNGVGNISADPQLASASHLSAQSPCIGAGSATYASGTDIDGEAWGNPPSIGCDEYHAGAVTGPLTVSLTATLTNVARGYPVGLTAFIEGHTDLSVWDFGDGFVEVNEPYTSHTWTAPGDYLVALWVFNDSYPEGVRATLTIHVEEGLHYVAASSVNPVAPYISWATAATNIQDAVDVAPPGATIFVTNGTYASGGRTTPATGVGVTNRVVVDKPLTLQSVNGPDLTVINGGGTAECLYLTNDSVVVGFTLTNGVRGASCHSTSAVLTNCVMTGNSYNGALGGTLNNCTLTGNSANWGGGAWGGTLNNCTLTGNSAGEDGNGWGGYGGGAYFCTLNNCTLTGNSATNGGGAYNCTLNYCTLTGNSAKGSYRIGYPNGYGGGACGGTLNNCTLSGNSAYAGGGAGVDYYYPCTLNNCTLSGNSATYSGGALYGTLNNCTLTGNSAYWGGGAYGSVLNNCTLSGNSASYEGGGAYDSTLNNCIVYFNTAMNGANYYQDQYGGVLNYCCTTPMPTNGVGNITNAPLFVNYAGGNLRLQSNSPCINAGNNAYVVGSTDLDGHPRIVFGTVDIGAYEYQTPTSIISYAWLQQYGLPTDGSADHADLDGTGMNVYQDWVAGLNPTNALSVLKMTSATKTNNPAGLVVTWESVNTRTYYLQRSTNLAAQPAFSTIQSNIVGQAGTTSYTDTNAVGSGPFFYRVGVGN
jgi:hypothetical protein